jgi:nucleoside phosphorylase
MTSLAELLRQFVAHTAFTKKVNLISLRLLSDHFHHLSNSNHEHVHIKATVFDVILEK